MQPETPQTQPAPAPPQTPTPEPDDLPIPSGVQRADIAMLEPDEHLVTVVHRHPIGIIIIYLEVLVGIIALVALTMLLAPDFVTGLNGQSYRLFLAGVLLAVSLMALILFIATYLYRQSRLIVSDKSLIQIIQKGLFVRKVSRLSMANVQDVTAEHTGFLATIFDFGTLNIETAGEEDNFTFIYCPNPDRYAERILDARQKYIQSLDTTQREASESG